MSTHNIPYQYKKKFKRNYPKYNYVRSYVFLFLLGTPERVRNSRGKRAISVRATEVLLYIQTVKVLIRRLFHRLYKLYCALYRLYCIVISKCSIILRVPMFRIFYGLQYPSFNNSTELPFPPITRQLSAWQ